ncbi:phage tail length tape measure family protein [[Empedobacter] haloabium]|uniref:Phage tail length tape measure family protein n=1 Tax=[Empedobacter] haloabium TaxID=592317 RepID=A0ABZ1USK6_9BURK
MTNNVGAANIELSVDSTGVETGLARAETAVTRTGRTIQNFGGTGAAAMDGVGAGANRSAARVDAATRSLIGSIQRTTATMEAGSRTSREYYEALANQRGVNRDALRPYLDQLDAVAARQRAATAAVDAANPALARVGVSAAQTAAALRGVPAQFTDIVTSLQGGQAPLTVFLQQGGQLRDMFGGAGAAARALGGYIAGLVNPFTLAAAGAAALAVAYNQGSKEADGYDRALAKTGNAAGTTSGQIADMARNIGAVVGTQGKAAEALTAMAASGQVAGDNLERFSRVAIEMERNVGRSVEDTVTDLAALGKAPLEASKKLSEQYHYLTAATYDQIRALLEQGRAEEAAATAQQAYIDAFDERSKKLEGRLGVIERSWRAVKDAAASTWDTILGVGREETVGQKLERASNVLMNKQSGLAERVAQGKGDDRISQQLRQDIAAAQAYKKELESQADAANRLVSIETGRQALDKAAIDWKEQGLKLLTKEQKLEQEIAETRRKGLAAGVSDKEIEDRVAAIRKSASGAVSGKSNDGIDAQIEAIKRRAAVEESVAKRSRDLLESNRAAGLVAEEQYIQAVEALDIGAFEREKARLQEELTLAGGKQKSAKEQAALRGQIAAVEENIITRRLQAENQLNQLEVKRNRTAAENYANALERQTSYRDSITGQVRAQEEANEQIGLSATALADLTATRLEDQAAIKDQNADIAEGIDLTGAMSAEYRAQAEALRELARLKRDGAFKQAAVEATREAEAAAKRMAEQIEDALTDSLMRGFESGKSFAENLRDTTINMFKTMVLRPTIQAVVTGNFSGGGAAGAGGIGNATSLLSAGQTIWNGFSAGLNGSLGNIVSSAGNLAGSQWLSSVGAGISGGANTAGAAAAYAQAGNTAVSSGLTAGASIATYVPMVAAAVASYFGAKAIANGYKVEGIGNLLNFAGLAGGVVNRAFGRRGKETTAQGITGMFGVDSLENGTQYTDWIKKGGWFRSDKTGTDTAALDATKLAGLNTAYKAIKDSTAAFATALGVPTDVVTSYTKQIKVALTGDEAKDQALLAQMFAGIGDELANRVVPGLESFVKEGETASTTLQRLAGEFKTVDALLDTLGLTSQQAFGAVGVASLAARDRLVQLAGGVDALASQSSFFAQNFLTQAEQLAPAQKLVTEQLAALGYASVTTNEQFKAAVVSLAQSGALATEAGAKTYAGLLALAPQFKAVADYAKQVADADAAGAVKAAADALQQLKDAASVLSAGVDTALSAVARSVKGQRDAVTSAYEAVMKSLETSINGVSASITKTTALSDLLKNTLSGMAVPGQETAGRAAAQAQIQTALAIAKAGGPLPDADSLRDALSTVSRGNADDYASMADYQRDMAQAASTIAELSGLTGTKLTAEQQQLKLLQDQKDVATKAYEAETERLDKILEAAQKEVDILNGVATGVQAIPVALEALKAAIAAAMKNPVAAAPSATQAAYNQYLGRDASKSEIDYWTGQAGAGVNVGNAVAGSDEAYIQSLYKELLGRTGEAAGVDSWEEALRLGQTRESIRAGFMASEEYKKLHPKGFAAGGAHEGGWRIVGENGPELENTGPSRIYSNGASASLFAGMEARLQSLETLMSAGLSRLIGEAKRGANAMENVDTRGVRTRNEMEIA